MSDERTPNVPRCLCCCTGWSWTNHCKVHRYNVAHVWPLLKLWWYRK